MHDIVSAIDYSKELLGHIDKIMVKSKYHRELLGGIDDNKIEIVSNGIDVDNKGTQ